MRGDEAAGLGVAAEGAEVPEITTDAGMCAASRSTLGLAGSSGSRARERDTVNIPFHYRWFYSCLRCYVMPPHEFCQYCKYLDILKKMK